MDREEFGNIERGDWLVYINGIEVPARSVRVSFGKWKMPEADVTFPPHKLLRRMGREDRMRLTVFYLDNHRYKTDPALDGPEFCLMFDGEITSWGYQNSAQQKFVSLHAIDFMSALTKMFPQLVSGSSSIAQALNYSGSGNPIQLFGGMPGMTMLYLLTKGFDSPDVNPDANTEDGSESDDRSSSSEDDSEDDSEDAIDEISKSAAKQAIERPFDMIISLFQLLHGTALNPNEEDEPEDFWFVDSERDFEDDAQDNRSEVVRKWFRKWSTTRRFTERWAPSPIIEETFRYGEDELPFPLIKAVADDERHATLQASKNMGSGLHGQPFWKIIRALYSKFYYEVSFVPTAPYHIVNEKRAIIQGEDSNPAPGTSQREDDVIMSYLTKPNLMFAVPPAFNVVWPSMVQSMSFNENYATQPTRTYMGNPYLLNELQGTSQTIAQWIATEGYPEGIKQKVNSLQEPLLDNSDVQPGQTKFSKKETKSLIEEGASIAGNQNLYNGIVHPEEYFKGPVVYSNTMPRWFHFLQEAGVKHQGGILEKYTEYEHYRKRFEKRRGNASMVFNPYILPGFPGVFIDDSVSGFHYYGYIVNVSHTLAAEQRQTSVQVRNGRTFGEIFEGLTTQEPLVQTSLSGETGSKERVDSFPVNPIGLIREQFQRNDRAREYYDNTFWGIQNRADEEFIFDPREEFNSRFINDEGQFVEEELNFSDDPEENNTVNNDQTGLYPDFVPKDKHALKQFDAERAMTDVSRPVCTLDQFIQFHEDRGVEEGVVYPANEREGKGAKYYRKILEYKPYTTYSGDKQAATSDSRFDWEQRLIRYREEAYNRSIIRG